MYLQKNVVLVLLFLILAGLRPLQSDWQKHIIVDVPDQINNLAIGKARNDDTSRIYLAVGGFNNGVFEVTYRGDSTWDRSYILPCFFPRSLAIGQGRNDSHKRLYVSCHNDSLHELTRTGNVWHNRTFGEKLDYYDLIVADARNDDTMRVYAVFGFGFSNPHGMPRTGGGLCELTFYDSIWHFDTVAWDSGTPGPNNSYDRSGPYMSLTLGQGRNDDTSRIYVVGHLSSHIFEFSLRNGVWEKEVIDSVMYPFNHTLSIVIAQARNDGIERLYCSMFEWTYDGSQWHRDSVGSWGHVAAGQAHYDDSLRVYVAPGMPSAPGYEGDTLYEYAYRDAQWQCSTVGWVDHASDSGHFAGVSAVADARNDGVNRVYCGSHGVLPYPPWVPIHVNLYEYTYYESGLSRIAQKGNEIGVVIQSTPNPFTAETDIRIQPVDCGLESTDEIQLKIYDATGRLVSDLSRTIQNSPYPVDVTWDGTDQSGHSLPCGIYFLKFATEDGDAVKKLMLIR